MTGVHNSLAWTQSGATDEVTAGESCRFLLETSPPDYVEKISRYLETSVGQSRQDNVSNRLDEAGSDSGDSLFLTQKPVPAAVRSGRRRPRRLGSNASSPRDLEESEKDNSSSSDDGESETGIERRKTKRYAFQKYSFPFLAEGKCEKRTLLPDQYKRLHHYAMGGFFKCVSELWQGYCKGEDLQSSFPTVDMEGEDIPPLSEEDKEKSDDEDIKVVERKRFVAPSKAKSQQTWCNQLKQQGRRKPSKARQDTSQGSQTKISHKIPDKASVIKSDNGEYCCRVLIQRMRNDEHTTRDRNFLSQTEKFKTNTHRTGGGERGTLLRGAEPCKLRRRRRQSTQINGQSQIEDLHAATSASVEVEETPSLSEDNWAEPPAPQTSDELEFNGKNGMEKSSRDDNILRQEERDVPDSKQKKKKKSAAENVGQEVDENLESDVRVEESVSSMSCTVEDGGKEKKNKKKKKKERKQSGEDVHHLQSVTVVEPLNNNAEIQKKKKKKKKEAGIVIIEEHEEKEASNETLDMPPMSTQQLEESGNCLENAAASQGTLESSNVKRKKHKRKPSSCNDATQEGEEDVDVNFCLDDSVTLAKGSGPSLKKKKTIIEMLNSFYIPEENEKVENVDNTQKTKEGLEDQNAELLTKKKKKKMKTVIEGVNSSYTHEENEKVENIDNTQKTKEDFEDQNAELLTKKKKKKKMREMFSREDKVEQNDDSLSVGEKEKKGTSSFLVADAEENDAQTHWFTKKKKKRKIAQDSVEKYGVQDFEKPDKTCQSASPETTDTGAKRIHTGSESESVSPMKRQKSAADAGFSPPDEAVVLKKKKNKKKKKKSKDEPCHVESVALKTSSSVSPKEKNKHGRSAEISHDGSTSDQATQETLNMVEHASTPSETIDMRVKKKKKKINSINVLPKENSLTESAESEPREKKKKESYKQSAVPSVKFSSPIISETSVSKIEMSSSGNIMRNKHKKVKRRLHNSIDDFLTDC